MSIDEIYRIPETSKWDSHTIRTINKISEGLHKDAIFFQYVDAVPDKLDFGVFTIKDDGTDNPDTKNVFVKTGKGTILSLMVTGAYTGTSSEAVLASSYHHMILDNDADTIVNTEESTDEDIIRFDAGGSQIAAIDSDELAVEEDMKITFDGLAGTHYWKYNSGTDFTELYIDGDIRAEF